LHVLEIFGADVDDARGAELFGEFQAIGVHVGDDDVPCPGMLDDRRRHAADRAGAGDQDILAEDVERESRMDGVAVGIEDRLDVAPNAQAQLGHEGFIVDPDVRVR